MRIRALKVSEVNQYIKQMMTRDPILNRINIEGELSNFKLHTSGHAYFSLKDGEAKINCAWFGAVYDPIVKELGDGMAVSCQGSITIYEKEGKYQLAVKQVALMGIGQLAEKFEKLKKKLSDLGYFDNDYKKKLPFMPKRVALVTSSTGAVLRDLLSVSGRRNPNIDVLVVPTMVQGAQAAEDIVRSIRKVNDQKLADVIILARGGGSIEELWPFNEEIVAKAIFESDIPIVSAVGHETDVTIADFVADLRAATPSEAAELVFVDLYAIRSYMQEMVYKLELEMNKKLKDVKNQLAIHNPDREYGRIKLDMDHRRALLSLLRGQVVKAMQVQINKKKMDAKEIVSKMDALSPLKTLSRGFVVSYDEEGNIVRTAKHFAPKDKIYVQFEDGKVMAQVNSVLIDERGHKNG